MTIDALTGRTLRVRIGEVFGSSEVSRVRDALSALGPFAEMTVDFSAVRRCDDAALASLARTLASSPAGQVALRGLTEHQWRLLTYLGLGADPRATAT